MWLHWERAPGVVHFWILREPWVPQGTHGDRHIRGIWCVLSGAGRSIWAHPKVPGENRPPGEAVRISHGVSHVRSATQKPVISLVFRGSLGQGRYRSRCIWPGGFLAAQPGVCASTRRAAVGQKGSRQGGAPPLLQKKSRWAASPARFRGPFSLQESMY